MPKSIKKNINGITLVALVVTVVVLLILAGVSLNLVLGNNGIISKAKEAKDKTAEAQHNDEVALKELENWLSNELAVDITPPEEPKPPKAEVGEKAEDNLTIDGKAPSTSNPIIPKDFIPINTDDAKWDAEGGPEFDKGLVITDEVDSEGNSIGNEFVWVPVANPSSMYVTVEEPIAITGGSGKTVVSGVTTSKYTASAILSGKTRVLPNDTSSFREPDVVAGSDGASYDAVEANYTAAGFSSLKDMAEKLVLEYDLMTKSLEKYKGFYIGRYELTANGEKAGPSLTNTNWYNLYAKCKELAPNAKVMTRMIYGLQWDATCQWLASMKDEGGNTKYDINNSSAWGNYSNSIGNAAVIKEDGTTKAYGSKQNTGYSEYWKANNIYDFAGNCSEWSQEAHNTYNRASRGGNSNGTGSLNPASLRNVNVPDSSVYSYDSSRATLIVL